MADEGLPLSKVYQLLEPGQVVFLTTAGKSRANIMTMSWHMMVEFEPPWWLAWSATPTTASRLYALPGSV
jgi:flavin reductase (DIM6/NTAB) family NADH-FMN oxidoreductase RutF